MEGKFKVMLGAMFFLVVLLVVLVSAAAYYRVNASQTVTIDEHGVCNKVINSGGSDLFVPTNTAGEWSAFRSNLPTGVSLDSCITYFVLGEGHVGDVYGYSSGIMGYINPEYYKGYFIYELRWNNEGVLILNLGGEVAQDFFNSVKPCSSCDTYSSGDAYFYYSGSGMTSWYWYASQPWDGVGTSVVAFE